MGGDESPALPEPVLIVPRRQGFDSTYFLGLVGLCSLGIGRFRLDVRREGGSDPALDAVENRHTWTLVARGSRWVSILSVPSRLGCQLKQRRQTPDVSDMFGPGVRIFIRCRAFCGFVGRGLRATPGKALVFVEIMSPPRIGVVRIGEFGIRSMARLFNLSPTFTSEACTLSEPPQAGQNKNKCPDVSRRPSQPWGERSCGAPFSSELYSPAIASIPASPLEGCRDLGGARSHTQPNLVSTLSCPRFAPAGLRPHG